MSDTICVPYRFPIRSVFRVLFIAVLLVGGAGCPGLPGSELEGDVNGDNVVNQSDLDAVTAAFGTSEGDPQYNPAADLTGDGQIGLDDIQAMVQLLDAQ